MATKIEELRERVRAAGAALFAASEKGDEDAELRALSEEDAARADLIAEMKKVRRLNGARLVRAARPAAEAGGYQVAAFDVGLYEVDPTKLPSGGVVVLRSPSVEVRKRSAAAIKAAADDPALEAEAAVTQVCECTVSPEFKMGDPAAIAYRVFWETVGAGVVNNAVMQIQQLGGFQVEHFKRVSR
ncbi:MAG TPA: hypothetical protein VNI01_11230 [Elusimicrobiota bacterium]|jgi:hypothetical protein|nr:hypothetical protein [Elusimicrobiota bacterium]